MSGLSPRRCEPSSPKMKPHLQSAALFAGAREVIIEHGTEEYRLQITKQGKLILTK